jgi:radical SAM superfamily enzyme YgiQ (UPF0313 family)
MKILLINPGRYKGKYCLREECCFGTSETDIWVPGLLTNIAGMLKQEGYDYTLIDLNSDPDAKFDLKEFDIVVSTAMAETALEEDLQILKQAKEVGCTTIAIINDSYNEGTILFNHKFIDVAIHDERETLLKSLLEGELKDVLLIPNHSYCKDKSKEYNLFYKADYTQLNLTNYNKAIIVTGRGCKYNCSFCYWKRTGHKNKPIDMITEEIKELKQYPNIKEYYLLDLNLTTDRKYLLGLCAAIKPLNIQWVCDGRVNEVDKELLSVMKDAGCRMITYGIESADNKILEKLHKGFTIEHALEKIKLTEEAGIIPYCCFIIGFPWDSRSSLEKMEKIIKQIKGNVSVNFLRPLHGTEIEKTVRLLKLFSKKYEDMKRGSGIDSWDNMPSAPTLYLIEQQLYDFRKRILKQRLRKKIFSFNSFKTFLKSKDKLKLIRKVF